MHYFPKKVAVFLYLLYFMCNFDYLYLNFTLYIFFMVFSKLYFEYNVARYFKLWSKHTLLPQDSVFDQNMLLIFWSSTSWNIGLTWNWKSSITCSKFFVLTWTCTIPPIFQNISANTYAREPIKTFLVKKNLFWLNSTCTLWFNFTFDFYLHISDNTCATDLKLGMKLMGYNISLKFFGGKYLKKKFWEMASTCSGTI